MGAMGWEIPPGERGSKLPDLYLIFNHKVTRLQEEDANLSLGITNIVELPEVLKEMW